MPAFFHEFDVLKTVKYESPIHLRNAETLLDYFDSQRDLYFAHCSDSEWQEMKAVVQSDVETEIKEKGYFEEFTKVGIFIARKT